MQTLKRRFEPGSRYDVVVNFKRLKGYRLNMENIAGDAHPVHLHLVNFEVLNRQEIAWDSATDNREDRVLDPNGITTPPPNNDGTYLVKQAVVQHNSVADNPSTYGIGFKIMNPT